MTVSPDLLITSTSLFSLGTIPPDGLDGAFGDAPLRGDDLAVPGRRGEVATDKVRDAYTFSVPLLVSGTSQGDFHDQLDALRALVNSESGPKTVTRVKPTASGNQTATCTARCELSGVAMYPDAVNANVVIDIRNLDGCWFGTAATPTIPATITVAGSARTHKITLTLLGAGTLTNTTLGVSVTVTTACTLTVDTFTASAGLATLTYSGDDFWFALAPGSNVITWSGSGTPTISYQPVY